MWHTCKQNCFDQVHILPASRTQPRQECYISWRPSNTSLRFLLQPLNWKPHLTSHAPSFKSLYPIATSRHSIQQSTNSLNIIYLLWYLTASNPCLASVAKTLSQWDVNFQRHLPSHYTHNPLCWDWGIPWCLRTRYYFDWPVRVELCIWWGVKEHWEEATTEWDRHIVWNGKGAQEEAWISWDWAYGVIKLFYSPWWHVAKGVPNGNIGSMWKLSYLADARHYISVPEHHEPHHSGLFGPMVELVGLRLVGWLYARGLVTISVFLLVPFGKPK